MLHFRHGLLLLLVLVTGIPAQSAENNHSIVLTALSSDDRVEGGGEPKLPTNIEGWTEYAQCHGYVAIPNINTTQRFNGGSAETIMPE